MKKRKIENFGGSIKFDLYGLEKKCLGKSTMYQILIFKKNSLVHVYLLKSYLYTPLVQPDHSYVIRSNLASGS